MSTAPERRSFYFIGERVCVDFVNTEVIDGGTRVDLLRGFDDLVAWCEAAELISADEAKDVLRRWSGKRDSQHAYEHAVRFRRTLRAMFERLAVKKMDVPRTTLDAINDVLGLDERRRELVRTKHAYELRLRRTVSAASQLLVPVAESAAALLSGDDLALVKKCQNPQCILFFYDTTRNHRRRWCSMTACGNRAKVAAHYRRARARTSDGSSSATEHS
jgi:predicted RNA-binding Zn ribbon-like protein